METHENIKYLREKQGMSQDTLAEKVGYKDRSSIAKVEAGKVDLSQSKIAAFAAALSVSPAQLMGFGPSRPLPPGFSPLPATKQWPVLGTTACGQPLNRETPDETVEAPADINADVVFRCVGDSMINARIFDGDYVFIRLQPAVENGQLAVVRLDDSYTLKRFYHGDGYVELRAENPTFPPIILRGEEAGPDNFEVVGLAVAFLSPVK